MRLGLRLWKLQALASSTWRLWAAEVCGKAEAEAAWSGGSQHVSPSCLTPAGEGRGERSRAGSFKRGALRGRGREQAVIGRKGHGNKGCEHAARLG